MYINHKFDLKQKINQWYCSEAGPVAQWLSEATSTEGAAVILDAAEQGASATSPGESWTRWRYANRKNPSPRGQRTEKTQKTVPENIWNVWPGQ